MKRCKHCGETHFGVVVKEIKESRYRVINGKAEEMLGEPEVKSETNIVYCFTCKAPITDEDIVENETCPVCGKVTEELVNGRCKECDDKVKSFSKMTKEQIIMMMMQQQHQSVGANEVVNEEVKEPVAQVQPVQAKQEVNNVKEVVSEPIQTSESVVQAQEMPVVKEVEVTPASAMPASNGTLGVGVTEASLNTTPSNENELNVHNDYEGLQFAPDNNINDDDILSQLDQAVPLGSINVLSEI